MAKRELSMIGLLSIAHGLVHSYLIFFTPFLQTIRLDLDLAPAAMGTLVSVAILFYGLGSLPAGYLAGTLGPKWTITIGLGLAGFGTALGFWAHSYGLLAVAFALLGTGASAYHPSSSSYLAGGIHDQHLGRAFAVHGIGSNVILTAAPVLTAWLATGEHWRTPFLVWGVLGLVVAAAIAFLLPQVKPNQSPETGGSRETEQASLFSWEATRRIFWWGAVTVFIISSLYGISFNGINTYLPSFYQSVKGLDVTASSVLASVFFAGGIFGQYVGGALRDRFDAFVPVFLATLLTFITIFAMRWMQWGYAHYALVLIAGLAVFSVQPAFNSLLSKLVPERLHGPTFGFYFVAQSVIGSTGPALVGWLQERMDLGFAFVTLGAIAFVTACVLIWPSSYRLFKGKVKHPSELMHP